jgi:hypothetical protein
MCVSVCNFYVLKARLHGPSEVSRRDWSFVTLLLSDTVRACLRGRFNPDQADLLATPVADRLFARLRAGTLHYVSNTAIFNCLRHLHGDTARAAASLDNLPTSPFDPVDDPTQAGLGRPGWYQAVVHLLLLARRSWSYFRLYAPRDQHVRQRMASRRWVSGRFGMMGPLARLYLGAAGRQNLLSRDLAQLDTALQELERAWIHLHEVGVEPDEVRHLLRQIEEKHEQGTGQDLAAKAREWLSVLCAPAGTEYPVLARAFAQIVAILQRHSAGWAAATDQLTLALVELIREGSPEPPGPDAPFPEHLCTWLEAIAPNHQGERAPEQALAAIRATPIATEEAAETADSDPVPESDEERQVLAIHLLAAFPADPAATVIQGMLVGQDVRQLLNNLTNHLPAPVRLEPRQRQGLLVQVRDFWLPGLRKLRGPRQFGDLPCVIHQVPDVLLRCGDPTAEVATAVEMLSLWQTMPPGRWPARDEPGELAARSVVLAWCLHEIEKEASRFYTVGGLDQAEGAGR